MTTIENLRVAISHLDATTAERIALIELLLVEGFFGFGGSEDAASSADSARVVAGECLEWIRDQKDRVRE